MNSNRNMGLTYGGSGYYGCDAMSADGRTTSVNLLSPSDSLGASCFNLQESLTMNSVLPTLHEDTELTMHDDAPKSSSMPAKLTKETLLATQARRYREVRPSG